LGRPRIKEEGKAILLNTSIWWRRKCLQARLLLSGRPVQAHCVMLLVIAAALSWADVACGSVWPTDGWATATPAELGMDESKLREARDYALIGGGSGMITRGGYRVYSWGDQRARYDVKSTTKSIGGTALGLAIADNFLALSDYLCANSPANGRDTAGQ